MISILRPRRGKKATAETQNIVLKRGEVFFESPDTGVGTGTGRIKIGDGTTAYKDLPYFIDTTNLNIDVDDSTIEFEDYSGEFTNLEEIIENEIATGKMLKNIISAIKQALNSLTSKVSTNSSNITSLTSKVSTNSSNITSLTSKVSTYDTRISALINSIPVYSNLKYGYVTIGPEDFGLTTDTIDISAGGHKKYSVDLMDLIIDKATDAGLNNGYMANILSINWIHVLSYNNPPLNVYVGDNGSYVFLVNNESTSVSIDAIRVYFTYI